MELGVVDEFEDDELVDWVEVDVAGFGVGGDLL